jgi:hypothetical protein
MKKMFAICSVVEIELVEFQTIDARCVNFCGCFGLRLQSTLECNPKRTQFKSRIFNGKSMFIQEYTHIGSYDVEIILKTLELFEENAIVKVCIVGNLLYVKSYRRWLRLNGPLQNIAPFRNIIRFVLNSFKLIQL